MPSKNKLNEGDIVDFSAYAGMYSDGARTSFMGRDGAMHTITATGGRPRQYTLNGKPITWEELKKVAGNKQLGGFRQGMTESEYNKDAVDKEIKKDPRIKGKEAKAIHGLLKGRQKTDETKLDEISAKTAKSYAAKADAEHKKMSDNRPSPEDFQHSRKRSNREKGVALAARKTQDINGEYMKKVVKATESRKLREGVLDDQDDDGFMAKRQLYDIAKYAVALHKMIQDTDNLEPWIQAKITKAADYIDTVKHYLEYNEVRDADDIADVMGPPDLADIDSLNADIDGLAQEETIVEFGDEDEGTELAGADILRMAAQRGIISPERARNPEPALDQAADSFAFDLGPVYEVGSSDVSIWLRQFIQQYRGAVAFDGPNAHIYESKIRAKEIYSRMISGLKGKK